MSVCMAVDKKMAVFKTALLAPGGTLLAWAVQQLLVGDPLTGGVAFVIGLAFIGGFVVLNERDIPYEDELASILNDQLQDVSEEQISDALKRTSEDVADSVEERTDRNK